MKDDFQDIVAILQERREHTAHVIRVEEIAAGRLSESMTPSDRKKEFKEALSNWYKDTEE